MRLVGNKTGELFAYIGKNSYWIMALHFMFFKLWDLCVSIFADKKMTTDLKSYPKFTIVYFIVGIIGPMVLTFILNKIMEMRRRYE